MSAHSSQAVGSPEDRSIVGPLLFLRAGHVLSADSKAPSAPGQVVLAGERIEAVLPADAPLPPGARMIDFGPKASILPGLIDCHAHLSGSRRYQTEGASPYLRAARAARDLLSLIEAGYTSVRDLGSAIAIGLRDAVNEGTLRGPRILAAGPIISQTGGHADLHSYPEAWVKSLDDSLLADGVDAVRLAVRRVTRLNADVVKICTTGGVGSEFDSPHDAHYTPEEIRAATTEAHRLGRRVAAHAQGTQGVYEAVRQGVDTIEHGYYLDARTADAMAGAGVHFVPTYGLRTVYRETLAEGVDLPPWRARKQREAMDAMERSLELARRAGVPIASGSDFAGMPRREHGRNARDIVALAEVLGSRGAIDAATSVAAEALGVEAQVGRIEAGFYADLAVFEEDPLERIEAVLTRPVLVVQEGRVVASRLADVPADPLGQDALFALTPAPSRRS